MRNPFRYFNSSPEVIRLVVMMYIRRRCDRLRIFCSSGASTSRLVIRKCDPQNRPVEKKR